MQGLAADKGSHSRQKVNYLVFLMQYLLAMKIVVWVYQYLSRVVGFFGFTKGN